MIQTMQFLIADSFTDSLSKGLFPGHPHAGGEI
jgi:redox-sensitive bicupin YhaK (pirin superfamily)